MFFIRAIKNIFLILLSISLLAVIFIIFQEDFLEIKYSIGYSLTSQYKKDKAIIAPYFDENFYLSRYGEAVKKSGLSPLDHFLKKGWYSENWRSHTDPNPWFNITIYQERFWNESQKGEGSFDQLLDIFRIKTNPFVNFINQPKLEKHHDDIDVWAKKGELGRAWFGVEGLMRLGKFNVILHVPDDIEPKNTIRFVPQVKRGLKLLSDNKQNKSFYQSDFIRNTTKYKIPDLIPKYEANPRPIVYRTQGFDFLMHYIYPCTDWMDIGKINPAMINIANTSSEPFAGAPVVGSYTQRLAVILKGIISGDLDALDRSRSQDFKDYLIRISDGFDLCIVNDELPIRNSRIVPGNIAVWIDEQELDKIKDFSVSFLLTKRKDKWNYTLRNEVWDKEKDFKIPTRFYLSYRDKDKYPEELKKRVMPTFSKKWVFNSQYNIVIENVKQRHYFSEKLLDALVTLTVPIYIGCPNIDDYFDPRGIIIVGSVDELVESVNSITPKTYNELLPYLKENKKRALKLLSLEKEIIDEFGEKLR